MIEEYDPTVSRHKIYEDFVFRNEIVKNEVHGLFVLTPGTWLIGRKVELIQGYAYAETLSLDDTVELTVLSRSRNDVIFIDPNLKKRKACVYFGLDRIRFIEPGVGVEKRCFEKWSDNRKLYGACLTFVDAEMYDKRYYIVDHIEAISQEDQ